MKIKSLLSRSAAVSLVLAGCVGPLVAAPVPAAAPTPFFGQGPAWNTPPAEYDQYRQQGFRDGIEGARKDFENHRPFTPENRDEYRHPHVPANVYRDYREAFREGYHRAVQNMHYHY